MQGIPLLVVTVALLYLGSKLLSFVKALQAIHYHPGRRVLISPASLIGIILPNIWGVSLSRGRIFDDKHEVFESSGWDIFSEISMLPNVHTSMMLADPAVIKEVTSSRARFPKPVEQYKALTFYGHNIVASEGEEWKKYRKISAPAFSDRNNKLVWDESIKIMQGLFNDMWAEQDVISVDHCVDITLPIALFVIGVAGFGRSVSWKEDTVTPPGHTMSYKDALHIVSKEFIAKLVFPDWAMGLTPSMLKVKFAFEELRTYMAQMIRDRQLAIDQVERHDLFTKLLEANDDDLNQTSLTEDELISNIYIFLLAGHEEKLLEHTKSVTKGCLPTYEEMPLLTYSMAVFYETLRMYPPVPSFPKIAAEDTSLVTTNIRGDKKSVPIPKGTVLNVHIPGVHYNPRYWDDPHKFNPSRFLKDWPRDAFLPFSSGARACLGRKFFETEGIAVLTILVSQYKITVQKDPQFAGETFEKKKSRILSATQRLTLTPTRVPLVFTRR